MEAKDKRNITLEPREINGKRASVRAELPSFPLCADLILEGTRATKSLRLWYISSPLCEDIPVGPCSLLRDYLGEKPTQPPPAAFIHSSVTQSSKPSAARQADWQQEEITGMRDRLSTQILQLSDQWKVQRAAKEEQRKKEAAEGKDVDEVESSDGEIDIVEDVQENVDAPRPPQKPKSKAFRVR
jgi:hypothetical protein